MTNERWLTACHEAGHAVASLMRGGGTFTSVTIERTDEYLGCTFTRVRQWDRQFASYAGPWAEARARWPEHLRIDEFDPNGSEFADYIIEALLLNPPDFEGYKKPKGEAAVASRRSMEQLYGDKMAEMDAARDEIWDRELEDMWPVMLSVAQLLIDDQPVDAELVRALIEGRLRARFGE